MPFQIWKNKIEYQGIKFKPRTIITLGISSTFMLVLAGIGKYTNLQTGGQTIYSIIFNSFVFSHLILILYAASMFSSIITKIHLLIFTLAYGFFIFFFSIKCYTWKNRFKGDVFWESCEKGTKLYQFRCDLSNMEECTFENVVEFFYLFRYIYGIVCFLFGIIIIIICSKELYYLSIADKANLEDENLLS